MEPRYLPSASMYAFQNRMQLPPVHPLYAHQPFLPSNPFDPLRHLYSGNNGYRQPGYSYPRRENYTFNSNLPTYIPNQVINPVINSVINPVINSVINPVTNSAVNPVINQKTHRPKATIIEVEQNSSKETQQRAKPIETVPIAKADTLQNGKLKENNASQPEKMQEEGNPKANSAVETKEADQEGNPTEDSKTEEMEVQNSPALATDTTVPAVTQVAQQEENSTNTGPVQAKASTQVKPAVPALPQQQAIPKRMNYTPSQVEILERVFYMDGSYASRERITSLSQELGVRYNQIKVWFQNRRMKKRQEEIKRRNTLIYFGYPC